MKYIIEYKDWGAKAPVNEILKIDMAKLDFLRSALKFFIKDDKIQDLIDSIIIFNQSDPYVNYAEMLKIIKLKLHVIGRGELIKKIEDLEEIIKEEEALGNLSPDFLY